MSPMSGCLYKESCLHYKVITKFSILKLIQLFLHLSVHFLILDIVSYLQLHDTCPLSNLYISFVNLHLNLRYVLTLENEHGIEHG